MTAQDQIEGYLRERCASSLDEAAKVADRIIDPTAFCAAVLRLGCSRMTDAELGRMIRGTVISPALELEAEAIAGAMSALAA